MTITTIINTEKICSVIAAATLALVVAAGAPACALEDDYETDELGTSTQHLVDERECAVMYMDVSDAPGYEDADWAVASVIYRVCTDGSYCIQTPMRWEIQAWDGAYCGNHYDDTAPDTSTSW